MRLSFAENNLWCGSGGSRGVFYGGVVPNPNKEDDHQNANDSVEYSFTRNSGSLVLFPFPPVLLVELVLVRRGIVVLIHANSTKLSSSERIRGNPLLYNQSGSLTGGGIILMVKGGAG